MTSFVRAFSSLRHLIAGALLAMPLACLQVGAVTSSRAELQVAGMVLECPVGSEGCPCTRGGGCDSGLICISGFCSSGGDGGEGVVYEFEFEESLAAPPSPSMDVSRSSSRGEGRWGRSKATPSKRSKAGGARSFSPDLPAAEASAPPSVAPAPALVNVTGETATPGDRALTTAAEGSAQRRQVVYTATLHVAVFDLDATIEFAENLPERYGGWIESRYDYQITLRLPAEHLFEVIEALSARGEVLGKTLQADDVTAEYVDLESRIRVLEQIVEQLELLLQRATSVEQALKIRLELDRLRIELAVARARMRQLSELIDFSTLTLYLAARGPASALPTSNDPFPWVDDLGVEATEYR